MDRAQVIVCGAGPVGVVAANRLIQLGVDVIVIEALPDCPEDMRASTFHPPTLEMMQELGFLDDMEAQGLRAPIYHYCVRRTGEVIAFDLTEIGDVTPYPYRLQCEQYKLARMGAARLASRGQPAIRFQRRAVSFEQDSNGVTLHAETPSGIETYRADYLIAADGANSIIRKGVAVDFKGFTYAEKFLTLSTDWPIERHLNNLAHVNYMADDREWCVLLRTPLHWRVLVPAGGTETDDYLLSDEKKSSVFRNLIGDGGADIATQHRTIYRVHQRVAEKYNHGRVLLIGDAAHLNNPIGGFGMNSGIHDAWNLAGKLSEILLENGEAEPLLSRFDRQRRTIMNEFVQAQTKRNKEVMENPQELRRFQIRLAEIAADPQLRRDYLMEQAMINSIRREAAIY